MPLPPALLARLMKRGIVADDAGGSPVVATTPVVAEPPAAAAAVVKPAASTHTGKQNRSIPSRFTIFTPYHAVYQYYQQNPTESVASATPRSSSALLLTQIMPLEPFAVSPWSLLFIDMRKTILSSSTHPPIRLWVQKHGQRVPRMHCVV